MTRPAIRVPFAMALIGTAALLSACGGRFNSAISATGGKAASADARSAAASAPSTASTTTTTSGARAGSSVPTLPPGSRPTTTVPAVANPSAAGNDPADKAVLTAYESYLADLSGLDDNLSTGYVGPLASVTTTRLAQASVRQAASILAAQEHGVGTLHDDHVSIIMTGPSSAALADCQDEDNFYLVSDGSDAPDPFVARGYFAGSAQMVLQDGRWLVDVFTTTHVTCSY